MSSNNNNQDYQDNKDDHKKLTQFIVNIRSMNNSQRNGLLKVLADKNAINPNEFSYYIASKKELREFINNK